MTSFIQKQVTEFVILFYGGLMIAMFWEVFRCYLRLAHPRAWVCGILNVLFWILAALITSSVLYYATYGALSVHNAIGFLLGATVWGLVFYGKMTQFAEWIYGIIKHAKKSQPFTGSGQGGAPSQTAGDPGEKVSKGGPI